MGMPWRPITGAEPDAMKVARPVLNGEDEETGRKALRLVLTQREGRLSNAGGGRFKQDFKRSEV